VRDMCALWVWEGKARRVFCGSAVAPNYIPRAVRTCSLFNSFLQGSLSPPPYLARTFGHSLLPFPGCTFLIIHSWQKVCRHSIWRAAGVERGEGSGETDRRTGGEEVEEAWGWGKLSERA